MQLKKQTTEDLQRLMAKDYGIRLTHEQAHELGFSLLRLTRLAFTVLARADEKGKLVSSGKYEALESNTQRQ